jgi:hypothetical protein
VLGEPKLSVCEIECECECVAAFERIGAAISICLRMLWQRRGGIRDVL